MMDNSERQALELLYMATADPEAKFREGQLEAITELVNKKARLLLVRRTGWGKSIVYFIATALIRRRGGGPTLIISPLIALMRNQLEAARRLGLNSERIDSTNESAWDRIFADIAANRIDVLLISPERLANPVFRERVGTKLFQRIGILVVDEAHCISDWGHDFRPHYRLIANFIRFLPSTVPMLATTATADDTVVADVRTQLGDRVVVNRGKLTRDSLYLDVYKERTYAQRLAWLADVLPRIDGSGIIFTLTIRDANLISEWLNRNGINAQPYHGGVESEQRELREAALLSDQIKTLVATSALGMGFDKPNLGFVVHFQGVQSIIHYYQQVGRAGRAVKCAYGILLSGSEDDEIIDFFIRNALPAQELVNDILLAIEKSSNGFSISGLMAKVNQPKNRIQAAIDFLGLESPSPITKIETRYVRTAVPFSYPAKRVQQLADRRRAERALIIKYASGGTCLMQLLAQSLGDTECPTCGRCSVCIGKHLIQVGNLDRLTATAEDFLNRQEIILKPRKKWPEGGLPSFGFNSNSNIRPELQASEGRSLAYFQIGTIGRRLRSEKYEINHFSDDTVAQAAEAIKHWNPMPKPMWIVPMVSGRRPKLVPDFARRLGAALGIPCKEGLKRIRSTEEQKGMENNSFRAKNLDGSLQVIPFEQMEQPGLFIDDMYDSGMTVTVAIALLRQAGAGIIYPFTLSKAANRE